MATEQADAGWILGVFDSPRDAWAEELRIQCKYGIAGLTFEACKSRAFESRELHEIHDSLIPIVEPGCKRLLDDFGFNAEWPLAKRGGERKNQRGLFLTHACNILDGYMEIPVPGDDFIERRRKYNYKPNMMIVRKTIQHNWSGDVYSLEVLPYHYYISGGAVVHNSIKGGEADIVVLFPDVSQSGYREWTTHGEPEDSIRRVFYVGMTRAREALYWAQPFGRSIGGYR